MFSIGATSNNYFPENNYPGLYCSPAAGKGMLIPWYNHHLKANTTEEINQLLKSPTGISKQCHYSPPA